MILIALSFAKTRRKGSWIITSKSLARSTRSIMCLMLHPARCYFNSRGLSDTSMKRRWSGTRRPPANPKLVLRYDTGHELNGNRPLVIGQIGGEKDRKSVV